MKDNPAASFIRTLLAKGDARYKVPVKDKETGAYTIQEIVKVGPACLITTTVDRVKGDQLDSRLFALDVPDDREQQRLGLDTQATIELDGTTPQPNPALIAMQTYLQALAPIGVVVPFVRALYDLLRQSRSDPRLFRDAARLLSLIKSVAILRHAKRSKDEHDRIVATLDDYQIVADLIADMYENTSGVSAKVREIVDLVKTRPGVTVTGLAKHLGISKQAVSRHVRRAIKEGWLVNTEHQPGYPAALRVGESLPLASGLPSPDQLRVWPRTLRTPVPRAGGSNEG